MPHLTPEQQKEFERRLQEGFDQRSDDTSFSDVSEEVIAAADAILHGTVSKLPEETKTQREIKGWTTTDAVKETLKAFGEEFKQQDVPKFEEYDAFLRAIGTKRDIVLKGDLEPKYEGFLLKEFTRLRKHFNDFDLEQSGITLETFFGQHASEIPTSSQWLNQGLLTDRDGLLTDAIFDVMREAGIILDEPQFLSSETFKELQAAVQAIAREAIQRMAAGNIPAGLTGLFDFVGRKLDALPTASERIQLRNAADAGIPMTLEQLRRTGGVLPRGLAEVAIAEGRPRGARVGAITGEQQLPRGVEAVPGAIDVAAAAAIPNRAGQIQIVLEEIRNAGLLGAGATEEQVDFFIVKAGEIVDGFARFVVAEGGDPTVGTFRDFVRGRVGTLDPFPRSPEEVRKPSVITQRPQAAPTDAGQRRALVFDLFRQSGLIQPGASEEFLGFLSGEADRLLSEFDQKVITGEIGFEEGASLLPLVAFVGSHIGDIQTQEQFAVKTGPGVPVAPGAGGGGPGGIPGSTMQQPFGFGQFVETAREGGADIPGDFETFLESRLSELRKEFQAEEETQKREAPEFDPEAASVMFTDLFGKITGGRPVFGAVDAATGEIIEREGLPDEIVTQRTFVDETPGARLAALQATLRAQGQPEPRSFDDFISSRLESERERFRRRGTGGRRAVTVFR